MSQAAATPENAAAPAGDVLFDVRGGIGYITLNRPETLNALNLNMIRLMNTQLDRWREDSAVHAVVVAGAGARAFCSGGDVKAVALAVHDGQGDVDGARTGETLAHDFFHEEYTLNHKIFTYPKPYIALVDGIVMGGGKGISAHGTYRVVTENTLFAMPETNIGFFPDVGGGYFLPRCPGQTGLYLAMTSTRIGPTDTIYIGFATHFVPVAQLEALKHALENIVWGLPPAHKGQIEEVLSKFNTEAPGDSILAHARPRIDQHFGCDHVEEIIASLQSDVSKWAADTLQALYAVSPTSLKVALRQIRTGEKIDFARVMTMEFRLSQRIVQTHDFYEGIRAALIDKDRAPKWRPAKVDGVDDETVDAFFAPLGQDDLIL